MKNPEKMAKVMREFGSGKLRSSSGQKVTNPKQAVAIGLSEARGMAEGGESKAMTKREIAFMKAKGAPRGMVRHEQEEARTGKSEPKAMARREMTFMKAKGAPKSMLKHEQAEARGMNKGGAVKRYAKGDSVPGADSPEALTYSDFKTAFAKNREKGRKTFDWYNAKTGKVETYTTEYKEEKKPKAKSEPIEQPKVAEPVKKPAARGEQMSARETELMARRFNPVYGAWQDLGERGDVSPNQQKAMATEPELARKREPTPVSKDEEIERRSREATKSYMEMTEPLRKGHETMVEKVLRPLYEAFPWNAHEKEQGKAKGGKVKKYAAGGLTSGHKSADRAAVRGKTRCKIVKMGK